MKTAKLFLSPLRRAKSRRDGTLLTVCFSLRTFSLREILLSALMFFAYAGLHAQVTIGGLTKPKDGTVLDLNSSAKGGLILSNVALSNLYTIPVSFPGMGTPPPDAEEKFIGALVYHEGGNGIPAGIYVWNGTNWSPATENCTSLDPNRLKLTPAITVVKVNDPVFFSVSSGASARCAEGEMYEWYAAAKNDSYSSLSTSTAYPVSTWTTTFATQGAYKVKIEASNPYNDPSSRALSNTAYVINGYDIPPEFVNGNYEISGAYCYDVKGPQNGQSNDIYDIRVDAFENGTFTKTFLFTHTQDFQDLLVLNPDDPADIIDALSQPAATFGSGNSSIPFTVTFKSDVKDLVLGNNAPVGVRLLVSYADNNSVAKVAYLDIRVQDAECYCPARVPTSIHSLGSLIFMCRNMGADYEIRSVADIGNIDQSNYYEYHGDWYRFGAKYPSLVNVGTNVEGGWSEDGLWPPYYAEETGYTNAGDWPDNEDTDIGNPCPSGWRLPTKEEWEAVLNTNKFTRYQGMNEANTWNISSESDTYANIMRIGDYLFFPAAGYRHDTNGNLITRGGSTSYWSSTGAGTEPIRGWGLSFNGNNFLEVSTSSRSHGLSIRCVQAD
jgi:uncharacterized protein (TIGR02145 family)